MLILIVGDVLLLFNNQLLRFSGLPPVAEIDNKVVVSNSGISLL